MGLLARLRRKDDVPRFRSAERLRAGDEERLETVRAAIRTVMEAIDREHDGLRRRLDAISAGAAGLADTDGEAYSDRSRAEESALAEMEAQLVWAFRRLDDLRAQRRFFEQSLSHFAAIASASPGQDRA